MEEPRDIKTMFFDKRVAMAAVKKVIDQKIDTQNLEIYFVLLGLS
jgi:hypothetical protein